MARRRGRRAASCVRRRGLSRPRRAASPSPLRGAAGEAADRQHGLLVGTTAEHGVDVALDGDLQRHLGLRLLRQVPVVLEDLVVELERMVRAKVKKMRDDQDKGVIVRSQS